jgi:hypothetical protein
VSSNPAHGEVHSIQIYVIKFVSDLWQVVQCEIIMKRKFKQWWSTIPPISTKPTITSHLKSCMFQVHFMCLLSRGMYLNRLCGNPVLQAQALSVIPPQLTSVSQKAFNINLLGRIINWYSSSFPIQVTSDMMELTLVRINV